MLSRRLLSLLVAPLLAGCSTLDSLVPSVPDLGMSSAPSFEAAKTTGLAVSDEPFAAQAGAAILTQGGSAADAVTAMFFTLAVTYPVAAGLGGGGICLVRDAKGQAHEFDFLARAPGGGGAFAVPGAVAGFDSLQRAYGALPWQRDLTQGEAYAATGFPISHVLSQRLAASQNLIRGDALLAGEFLDAAGQPKPEGTVVANPALSLTLGNIRLSETDGFYTGAAGAALIAASGGAGAPFSAAELAGYRATQSAPRSFNRGGLIAAAPGAGTGAGAFAASLINNAGGGDPQAAVVASLKRTLAGFNIQSVPPDLGSTGFAALDANGEAAACAVTMNAPFGAAKSASDSGVTFAATPASPGGIAGAFLTPMIATDRGDQVAMVGAGSGGPNGSAAILYAFLRMAAGQPLGRPGDMRSTGLAPAVTANTIACQNGLCVALPDPGGYGLGARVADQPGQ